MSMKKKNFWSAVLAMGLAATLSVGFVGCSDDDEPTPEIVTDNPLDKEVYYIAGKVTDNSTSNVMVSARATSLLHRLLHYARSNRTVRVIRLIRSL